jgi:hypothetical protein
MKNNPEDSDKLLITSAAGAIAKVAFYICLTIIAGMWLSNCSLDSEVIEQCQASCKSAGTHMQSITSTKCTCADNLSDSNTWVLPTK